MKFSWFALGVLAVIAGVIILGNAYAASFAITWVTGILMIVSGVLQVIAGFSENGAGRKILVILLGVAILALGIFFLNNPVVGLVTLTWATLIGILAGGIFRILLSFQLSGSYKWGVLLSGVLSLILGAYLLGNTSVATLSLLGILMGIEMIFNGISLVTLSFFKRDIEGDTAAA